MLLVDSKVAPMRQAPKARGALSSDNVDMMFAGIVPK